MAVLSAAAGTLAAYGAALVTARSRMPKWCKGVVEGIAMVTNTIPGMVLGVAYMFVFSGTSLQNTMGLLIICNVIHYFSSPYLMMKNSLSKLNESWETTAGLMGDSWIKTIIRIVTPNVKESLWSVFGYYFTNSCVTVSAIIFLVGSRTMVLTTKIKQLQYLNKFNEVFVLSLLIFFTNLIAKALFVDARTLPRIRLVWDSVPLQLAKENKKFFFGQIKKGARSSEYEIAIQWLVDCGLIYKVNRVNEPNMPLKAYKSMNAYKLFVLDVGLLGAMSELEAESILEGNDIFIEFKGALTEQYVLQQLISDTRYNPYYFGTEKATFEQDFLIQKGKDIVPIEVKAGENIRSQSLKAYCDKYKPNKAVRFSTLKYMDQGWMENIPLYAVCNL